MKTTTAVNLRWVGMVAAAVLVAVVWLVAAPLAGQELATLQMDTSGSIKGEIKPAPWSGYWWSRQKGYHVNGWNGHTPGPFQRYDDYVVTRTGKNPGAHAWEAHIPNTHYNPKAEQWEGHCNGWSAASILEPEPREPVTRNGITFSVGDQKCLLSEMCMNTYCVFYGERNWGDGDIDDIYPDVFHRVLLEYLHGKKSAIIADTDCERQVWNFPLYKFESSWSSGWFNDKKLKVTTTCYFVADDVAADYVGTKWFTTTFTYNLFLDDGGNVVGGEWTGGSRRAHPDFIWVPTADAPAPPNTVQENPRLQPQFVHEITRGLPRDGMAGPELLLVEAGLDPTNLF